MPQWTTEDATSIRSQLERMTTSHAFAHAGRMTALLNYLVESELNGTSDSLNQYRIAIDVLGRDERFDPAADSIVRVEIGRLRGKLREFYATDGVRDPVVFDLPKGRYRPIVKLRNGGADATAVPKQEIRYCRAADGVNLAYAISGHGYPLVKAGNWLSHLEFDHLSPIWRHWWRDLAARYRLIRYDARGCGLSDWDFEELSFDAWVEDLERVVEAAAPPKFALYGVSQGAAVAIAYAVRHPERISHLILYGGFARGARRRSPASRERSKLLQQLIRVGWADPHHTFRQVFGSLFIPEGTPAQLKWFDELQRMSMSAANAERYPPVSGEIDVTPLLAQVRIPTLVIHADDDRAVPFSEAKILSAGIPGARLSMLAGSNHIILENEPAWPRFLAEIDAFIAGEATRADADASAAADMV